MSPMEEQVRRARQQLLLNRWLANLGHCMVGSGVAFLGVILIARVAGLEWPLHWIGGGLLAAGGIVSLCWTGLTAESQSQAAVALDNAVGLKERVSSGLYCRDRDDPFAQAVHADAEHVVTGIRVRTHMPLRWARSLSWGLSTILLSLAAFWFLPGMDLFGRQRQAQADELRKQDTEVRREAVLKQSARLKVLKEENPILRDNKEFETEMDIQAAKLETQMDARREKIKQLENLMDSVQEQKESEKYESIQELKKMLRRLQDPQDKASPVSQVADALSRGDFKQAEEALNKVQDELARHEKEGNRERVEQLQKQLDMLGRNIEKLALDSKKMEDLLKQAGVKPEDMERMLENLSKKDFEEIKEALEKMNISPEQAEQLAKQMSKRQMAESMAKNLGAAMAQAAQASGAAGAQSSRQAMSAAGDMLSDAEQLEQELQQLESAMAELGDIKKQAGCGQCQGEGCGSCQGNRDGPGQGDKNGPGMGRKMGQGQGGLAEEQETGVAFKKERTPVYNTPGSVIGEFLIKGSQFKRDAASEFSQVMISAEKDLSQSIERDKIPPYARKTIKQYFERGHRQTEEDAAPSPSENSDPE